MFLQLVSLSLLSACSDEMTDENIKKFLNDAFTEANSTKGHYGWELVGKGQWFEGQQFDKNCLESNDLAFQNHNKVRQGLLQPTYVAQRYLVSSTNRGFCLDLGKDLSMNIGEIKTETSYSMRKVSLSFAIQDPTPWFSCLRDEVTNVEVLVETAEDGKPKLDKRYSLAFQSKNDCPKPIEASKKRSASAQPTAAPAGPPSVSQAKQLAQSFDSALKEGNWSTAKNMVSCVNLYEANSWGKCAVSEVLPLAPVSGEDPRGGTPWLEYRLNNFGKIETILPDKADPTLFHVAFSDRKTKARRSFSMQYVNAKWKLLGVLSIYDAGVTPLRFINDLHLKDKRKIFARRLQGEQIDYRGKPLDPYAEQQ